MKQIIRLAWRCAAVVALSGPLLTAQNVPAGWNTILESPGHGVKVKVRMDPDPKGWVVQFENNGNSEIHFNFGFGTTQSEMNQIRNGRVHLNSTKRSGKLLVAVPTTGAAAAKTTSMRIFNVRLGRMDKGNFWTP